MSSPPTGSPSAVTCRVLKLARQPYYRWLAHPVTDAETIEAYRANALFDAHSNDPEFGYRYLVEEARDVGELMAERTAWRICSQNRLWSVFGKKRGKNGKVGPPVHDDLVERDFTAGGPNQLWLSDITEHRTDEGKLYLCAIKDVFSNRIVGYSIDSRMKSQLAIRALHSAVARRGDVAGCILHSDRGSQGGFNWSSQHLDRGGVQQWRRRIGPRRQVMYPRVRVGSGVRIGRCVRRMRSPGRPEPSRAVQRQFWGLIATGITSAEAALKVGVSVPVGVRWFRHAGGMPPISLAVPTGRYLSFEEREEIALLRPPNRSAFVRLRAGSAATRQQSPANCAATQPRAAGSRNTGRWWRSGSLRRRRSDRKRRGSRLTTGCVSTSRIGSPGRCAGPEAASSSGPSRRRGRG